MSLFKPLTPLAWGSPITSLAAIPAETLPEAHLTPFSREAPKAHPSPQSRGVGHPLFREAARVEAQREARLQGGNGAESEKNGVIGEIEGIFRRGIRTREDDDRFWELGYRVSPFMRRMAALLEASPRTLLFEYPETEKSVGYTVMRGDRLVDRLHGWGEKIVMANISPTVSAHERTHAMPWERLTREEQTTDAFDNPVALPPLFPKIALPEINPEDDILDITLALVQRMFLDEAMAGLAEVFIANDLVMAGLNPRLLPEYVWEEKGVYDAGGLEAYLDARLYLGDNHKSNYPVAIAWRVARKIKRGESLEGIQIADVTGETDLAELDVGKIWAEVMAKAGGAEKFKQFLKEYLSRDPLKYVGNAKKFKTDGDEMRDAAQVLGGMTERFEALLEKTNDVGALQDLLDGSEMERFFAKLNGERLSTILGILLKKAKDLLQTNDDRAPRFARSVSALAGKILEARGYPHAAIEARESPDWFKQGQFFDEAGELAEMTTLWKGKMLPWKNGDRDDWDGFLDTLEACLDDLDRRFRGKLQATTPVTGLLREDRFDEAGLGITVHEIVRLYYLLSQGKKRWSVREKNLLGRLLLAGVGVNEEILDIHRKSKGKEWRGHEAVYSEIEALDALVHPPQGEGPAIPPVGLIFDTLNEVLEKGLLNTIVNNTAFPLQSALFPLVFLIETRDQLKEMGNYLVRYAEEVEGWKNDDTIEMADPLLNLFDHFKSAYLGASRRIGDNTPEESEDDNLIFAQLHDIQRRIGEIWGYKNPAGNPDLNSWEVFQGSGFLLENIPEPTATGTPKNPDAIRAGLAADMLAFCKAWHRELLKWEKRPAEEGSAEEFMKAVEPLLDTFDRTFPPERLDRKTFPRGPKEIEPQLEIYVYAALNIFKCRLRADSAELNFREKRFCRRLALLAVGKTEAHPEEDHLVTPPIPIPADTDRLLEFLEEKWSHPDRLKTSFQMGEYLDAYPLLLLAFLIEDEGTLERFGKIIQHAAPSLVRHLEKEEHGNCNDCNFDYFVNQLGFAYQTAAKRIGYNGKQLGKVRIILRKLNAEREEFLDYFFYSQNYLREWLEKEAGLRETAPKGRKIPKANPTLFLPEDKGNDSHFENLLDAASNSLDFGQPLIQTAEEMFDIAKKLLQDGRYGQALTACAMVGRYFTFGLADKTALFRELVEYIHSLPLPDEDKDEVLLERVEDQIPAWDGGRADPALWGKRMEVAEILGPILLREAYPKARKVFLNRLASYANPKEQRLELLSLSMYKRVWKALVLPLVELHPELLEPGFYEHLLALSPKGPEAQGVYYRALGAIFPLKSATLDPEADIASWDPRLIEMGAMPAEAVEQKLIAEISTHIADENYPAERADKLKTVLNAFIRFRINEYIRDVEAKPTQVRYSANELREIPILDWLYFALDDGEAAQAYAFGATPGEPSLADGLAIRATALWDYFEGENDTPSPVQAAILDALLTSENLSEARAKLPLYEELMTQEAVATVWKTKIFEGLKRGGLLSPAIWARYEKTKGNREEAERIVAVFSRMLALNEGESPNDFSFTEALRWEEAGRGEIFWERYARMQDIFRGADEEVLRLRRNDRAVQRDEDFTPSSPATGKTIFQGTAGTVRGQDHARTRSFFADPANCLDFTHPADLGLLPEYLIYFWGLETPVPKGIVPLEILIKHERSLREKEREMTTGEKLLQIAWAYKILLNIGKFPDAAIRWMDPLPLKHALRKEPEVLKAFRTGIREAERRFYETRDAVHESAGGGLPEVFRDLPLLPRFFLMESWMQMSGAERAKRRERIEKITKGGGSAQEVLLAFLEAEGLEKGGQLLYMMYGVLPEDWREIFGKTLETNQPATPFEVRGTVETELSPEGEETKLEDLYGSFEETPVGVGTIAQVHKAVLKATGETVAVKVIAGSRANKVDRGMERLKLTAAWYAIQRPARFADVPIDLVAFIEWFKNSMAPEFNLALEAGNMEAYAAAARGLGLPGGIPKPSADRRSERLLEMEWIPNGGKTAPEDALTVARLVLSQMFLSGLTHDDPHPGNVRGGYLLDYGRVERIEGGFREAMALFLVALGTAHNYPGIDPSFFLEVFQKLSALDAPSGGRKINPEKIRALENYVRSEEFTQAPFNGNLLAEILRRGGEAGLALSPKVYVMMKTLMATDSLLRSAGADTSLAGILTPILLRAKNENFSGKL